MAMNPGMKMLMMDRSRKPENNRSEYGGGNRRMIGYDRNYETENRRRYAEGEGLEGNNRMAYGMDEPESRRRRDSRGRYMEGEGWQGNRSYPESRYEPESRRRRDSRGRYMMGGSRMDADYEDNDGDDMQARSQTWFPPYGAMPSTPPMGNMYPIGMHPGNSYGDVYAHGSIYAPGAMNKPMGGMYGGNMSEHVDEHTARLWVREMDGGEHFAPEQAEQFRNSICPECKRWEYYTAINAMYSDHCETAKEMNIDKPEYYARLARDFLMDKDAGPHKLRKYMETIPK